MRNNFGILEKVDWTILNQYIEDNLIMSNKHPEYDIWILNYTPKTQFNKAWDIYTISCRGLVVDIEGNIIARPIQKFMNFEEHNINDINLNEKYEVFEKVDGSLGIQFYYEPSFSWIIASRGSFISEQAVEAQKIFNTNVNRYDKLNKDYTYIYEIIYPENIVVVNYYGMRDLILLAIINTKTGEELSYNQIACGYSKLFTVVKKHKLGEVNKLADLKKLEEENREGFVLKFADGFRVKAKFENYIRLHRIVTNVSNVNVWEHLVNGEDLDILLNNVPDEFYNWVRTTVEDLEDKYVKIELSALKEFINLIYERKVTDRREFAFNCNMSEYRAILFKMFDSKPYDNIIWRMIKPVWSKKNNVPLEDS